MKKVEIIYAQTINNQKFTHTTKQKNQYEQQKNYLQNKT